MSVRGELFQVALGGIVTRGLININQNTRCMHRRPAHPKQLPQFYYIAIHQKY